MHQIQTVCQLWRALLTSQSFWKRKCKQFWPYYPFNDNDNYYRLFLKRAGGHFVTSAKHFSSLKKLAKNNGWTRELVQRLTPQGSFKYSWVWRIREDKSGLQIIYNTVNIDKSEGTSAPQLAECLNSESVFNLKHEHLSPPIAIFPKTEERLWVIMDPVVELSYADLLGNDRTGELTEKKVIKIIKQILTAIKFLHQNNQIAMLEGGVHPMCEIKRDWFQIKLFNYVFTAAQLDTLPFQLTPDHLHKGKPLTSAQKILGTVA